MSREGEGLVEATQAAHIQYMYMYMYMYVVPGAHTCNSKLSCMYIHYKLVKNDDDVNIVYTCR